ncbi:MAG: hypothetical protein Q8K12_10125 [Thiobacillus sp.]|nr:hypothetical protein [Thiobacillus sp.]
MATHLMQSVPSIPTDEPQSGRSVDSRQQAIDLSACFLAEEAMGFASGGGLEDWLSADRESRARDAHELGGEDE